MFVAMKNFVVIKLKLLQFRLVTHLAFIYVILDCNGVKEKGKQFIKFCISLT